jgi:integrase
MSTLKLETAWQIYYKEFSSKQPIGSTDLGYWHNHIQPFFQDCYLEAIDSLLLIKFKESLESKISLVNKPLSPQTIKHCLSLLKRMYNKLRLLNLYRDPVPYFTMPTFDNHRIRFLSEVEAKLLLSTLKTRSHLWYHISSFALNTGMRAGEIFNLRCENIDLKNSRLYLFDTKTNKNRLVPLNLKAFQTAQEFYTRPGKLLFSTANQKIQAAGKIFRKAVNDTRLNAGITDRRQRVVFHTLRHTFASWLVRNGIQLEVVSKLLGHTSLQVTLRYAHLSIESQHIAVKTLDNV